MEETEGKTKKEEDEVRKEKEGEDHSLFATQWDNGVTYLRGIECDGCHMMVYTIHSSVQWTCNK